MVDQIEVERERVESSWMMPPDADMDLEQFRQSRSLSYAQLAVLIGIEQNRTAQAYALGEMWPGTERLEQILRSTAYVVTIHAMHQRRLRWLRQNNRLRSPKLLGSDSELPRPRSGPFGE